jgi:uncharacterized membrane protein YkoI
MKSAPTRRTLLLALALLPLGTKAVYGDDDDDDDDKDHNRASRAVQQGAARPLAEILNKVRTQIGGDIVGLKFKSKDGRYVYKLKVVTPTGQLREVSVDAATGEIVKDGDD